MKTISNEEMLLEMSNVLQVQLRPIKEQMDRMEMHVDGVESCIRSEVIPRLDHLEFRVGKLEQSVKVLETDMGKMKESVKVLETDMEGMKESVKVLETDMGKLKESVKVLEVDVGKLMLTTENYILPTLGELKECYTGAYERYCKWADQMEGMSQDVDILKRVVAVHSRKLKHMS